MAFAVARPGEEERERLGWPGRITFRAGLLALVFGVSLGVRLANLDLYSTTDEGYWMQRSIRFGAALVRGDFGSTYRAGHPGVSVMWAGLIGIGWERLGPFLPERYTRYELLERAPGYVEAFSGARRAVAIVASALVSVAVLLTWRLFGTGPALAGGTLLVLDPYVVGMTRLLHVDALLAPLMTVSALAGLIFWTRSRHWGYLLLSTVTAGLAFLTKAPSGYLPIFLGLVCLVALARGGVRRTGHVLLPFLIWAFGALVVYGLLFPAVWVVPLGVIDNVIRYVHQVGLQPHDGNFFLGRPVLEDPGPFYYLVAVPLRLSPLVALGMGLLALRSQDGENRTAIRWVLVYVGLFTVLMTLASKKFDRYLLPGHMMLDILAGVGLWRLVLHFDKILAPDVAQWGRRARALVTGFAVASIAIVQLVLLAQAWPYPIAYYNPLAGGAERAQQLIMVGWGEGLEQAADFLNGLPNAENLYVVTSYNHVMRPRFVGTTIPIAPYIRGGLNQGLPTPDYIVIYVNSRQRRQISPEVARAEAIGQPVFEARINGLPYAWVYWLPRTGPRQVAPPPILDETDEPEN